MKKMKKIIALLLVLSMIFGLTASISAVTDFRDEGPESEITFNTLSDPHFYPYSLTGDDCDAWKEYCSLNSKLYRQSEGMIRTAIETMMVRNPELKYILIPGDLTKDSEYQAHVEFAKILAEYEEKYGVEFIVTTGNHDINQDRAITYENGKAERARSIQADEFREVYADFGYDLAIDTYSEAGTNTVNGLSYAVELEDSEGNKTYRLIVVDSCKYTFDPETADHKTDGAVTEECMQWIKSHAEAACAAGQTPMVMIHHGLAAHMETEPSLTYAFPLDNYMEVAEQFASWGIHYAFTGHLHTDDIAATVNDDGEVLYDCETGSISGFPCTYREMTAKTYSDGETEVSFESVAFDDAVAFTFEGVTYPKGEFKKTAFSLAFGGATSDDGNPSTVEFLMAIVKGFLGSYVEDIKESGSITEFLKTMNIDLEQILRDFLSPYIGQNGIAFGNVKIFTVDNLMWFIDDLLGQIYDLYIAEPDNLYNLLEELITEICSIQVSELPCTKYIEDYHFGDASRPGNLGELVLSAMIGWYNGNEDNSDDAFLLDAIAIFETGSTIQVVFDTLVDLLLHDLVEDSILAKLEIRLDKLFDENSEVSVEIAKGINEGLSYFLRGDFTYMNLVNTVFEFGILPWDSIYDILDELLISKYITPSFMEGLGGFVAYILRDFSSDSNPIEQGDYGVVYSSEAITPEVSRENYRLPTMLTVTMGEDSSTSANISWHSKWTVGGDIEIYKADSEPAFTGTPTETADFNIDLKSEEVIRSYPGIDLGVFGLFQYEFKMNRHTVKLTGLEPGATYYYRVGDAERGWWSDVGTITTADGGKETTILHLADPQSMTEAQYERAWAATLKEAFAQYPETDFIIGTGDFVDHGNNSKQWAWVLNTGSEYLMNTYLMPASGNHEGMGENAIVDNFVIPNAPEQDTVGGVYYSYDYNNVHIAVLNSENLGDDEGLSEDQIAWLKADMNASDAQWKFVVIHKAPYSQGSHYEDDDVCAIRDQLSVLMPELDVDLVFQGHDHVYMRTGSLVNNANTAYDSTYLKYNGEYYRTQIQPMGTTYVISGTSGVKTYIQNDPSLTDEYFPRGESIVSVDAPMFSAVEVVDGVLYFAAHRLTDEGSEVVDRFAIQKDTTQGDAYPDYVDPDYEAPSEDNNKTLFSILDIIFKILKVLVNIIGMYFV